jgi:hypothetical protein
MGVFGLHHGMDDTRAERLHLIGESGFEASLSDPRIGVAAFSDRMLAMAVARRPGPLRRGRPLSEAELHALVPGLGRYRLREVVPSFGQFADPLYILTPESSR